MSNAISYEQVSGAGARSGQEISDWIASYLARTLEVPLAEIDRKQDLENLGLNSALVVSMIGDLEDWLSVELSPSLVFDYPTIEAIANHLAQGH